MKRRHALATLAALAAGLAGCSDGARDGPTPAPGAPTGPGPSEDGDDDDGGGGGGNGGGAVTAYEPLDTTDFDVRNGTDGRLQVELVVENPSERTRNSLVTVATTADGESVEGRTSFTIRSGETRRVNVTVPVEYEAWGGTLDFRFEPQD